MKTPVRHRRTILEDFKGYHEEDTHRTHPVTFLKGWEIFAADEEPGTTVKFTDETTWFYTDREVIDTKTAPFNNKT